MPFYIEGLYAHERMHLNPVKANKGTNKVTKAKPANAIEELEAFQSAEKRNKKRQQSYGSVERLSRSPAVLNADKVMTSPVVTIHLNAKIEEALTCFKENKFQHVPVVDNNGKLVGIVSERDVFRYVAGMTVKYQQQDAHTVNDRVKDLMISEVVTATVDTDVRHIAHVFIEQGIGAMPIMENSQIKGIITNSDLLNAVMSHYSLEIWA